MDTRDRHTQPGSLGHLRVPRHDRALQPAQSTLLHFQLPQINLLSIIQRFEGLQEDFVDQLNHGRFLRHLGEFRAIGLDVIQHYTLRLILWHRGHTPRNYARFLDYATERIFLQKVGGGFIFIHRLLMEHFAELDQGSPHTSDIPTYRPISNRPV